MISKQEFDQKIEDANNLKLARLKEIEALIINKQICVYGYGNKGRHLAKQLKANGIEFSVVDGNQESLNVAVSDGFNVIRNLPSAEDDRYCYILCSGQYQLQQQARYWENYIYLHECTYYYDLPHIQSGTRLISDIILQHRGDFFRTYEMIHPLYKNVYLGVLLYRASLNPVYLQPIKSHVNNMWLDVPSSHIAEGYTSLCDVGAYDGDSILAFSNCFHIKKAIAIEVNTDFNERILANSSKLTDGVQILPFAAWSQQANLSFKQDNNGMFSVFPDVNGKIEANALDNLVTSKVDVVKFDIEGSEFQAIQGAKEIIRNYQPDLFVAAYHNPEDFYVLPDMIFEMIGRENFQLCVGHYSDVFDDTIFYFLKSSNNF